MLYVWTQYFNWLQMTISLHSAMLRVLKTKQSSPRLCQLWHILLQPSADT